MVGRTGFLSLKNVLVMNKVHTPVKYRVNKFSCCIIKCPPLPSIWYTDVSCHILETRDKVSFTFISPSCTEFLFQRVEV